MVKNDPPIALYKSNTSLENKAAHNRDSESHDSSNEGYSAVYSASSLVLREKLTLKSPTPMKSSRAHCTKSHETLLHWGRRGGKKKGKKEEDEERRKTELFSDVHIYIHTYAHVCRVCTAAGASCAPAAAGPYISAKLPANYVKLIRELTRARHADGYNFCYSGACAASAELEACTHVDTKPRLVVYAYNSRLESLQASFWRVKCWLVDRLISDGGISFGSWCVMIDWISMRMKRIREKIAWMNFQFSTVAYTFF